MFKLPKLNISKRASAVVAFIVAIVVIAGLVGTIQYYKHRPEPTPTATVFTEVTTTNFAQEIQQSTIPVYVVFYVDQNCPQCDEQLALVEKVAADYAGKIKFTRIHASQQQAISRGVGVTVVPTSIFVNPTTQQVIVAQGKMTEAELRQFLDAGLAPPAQPDPGNGNGGAPPAPPVPPATDNPDGN